MRLCSEVNKEDPPLARTRRLTALQLSVDVAAERACLWSPIRPDNAVFFDAARKAMTLTHTIRISCHERLNERCHPGGGGGRGGGEGGGKGRLRSRGGLLSLRLQTSFHVVNDAVGRWFFSAQNDNSGTSRAQGRTKTDGVARDAPLWDVVCRGTGCQPHQIDADWLWPGGPMHHHTHSTRPFILFGARLP